MLRWFTLPLSVLLGSSCGQDDLCGEGDDLPRVEVVNQTGNTIEEITFRPCDGGEVTAFPVPPPGLGTGDSLTLPLPNAGCFILNYSGEGCVNEPAHQTGEVCMDETHTWIAGEDTHLCQG